MKIVIKKGIPEKEINKKLDKLYSAKVKKDLRRYCGSINLKEDPLSLQKKWRNEW